MSFMPPEVPDFPPEDMNGGPPEDKAASIIEEVGNAIKQAAVDAAASHDPEAYAKFGQGAWYFAQSLEKLMPVKPSPDVQLKAEAEMVKHGASLASQEAQHEDKLRVEQQRTEAQQKAKDGNGNPSERKP